MAKTSVDQWSTTAADNTDVGGIDIDENCLAGNINNAIREMMAQVSTDVAISTGATTISGAWTFTADATFNDDVQVLFGDTGSQMWMYHNSTSTGFIRADNSLALRAIAGTARIESDDVALSDIAGNFYMRGTAGASTFVHYAGNPRIQTTSAGATITGALTADGLAGAATGYGAPVFVLEDQKASGTDGGAATSGSWETRDLQTEARDDGGVVSITSNEFTPTVDGWVEWSVPAYRVGVNQSRLYNVTDSTVDGTGKSTYCDTGGGASESTGGGPIIAGKTYRIEHRVNTTKTINGHGVSGSFGTEVYTRVQGWRT